MARWRRGDEKDVRLLRPVDSSTEAPREDGALVAHRVLVIFMESVSAELSLLGRSRMTVALRAGR